MTRSFTIIAALLTIWLIATVERAEASCGDYVVSGNQLDQLKSDLTADLPSQGPCHGPTCQQRSRPGQPPAVPPSSGGGERQEATNSHEFLPADIDREPPSYDSYESGVWGDTFYPRVERPPRIV